MGFDLIIAATDFSPGAGAALGQALTLARRHGARLLLTHVLPPMLPPSPLLDEVALTQTTLALREGLRDSSARELAALAAKADGEVEVETRLIEGDPARELAALAKETGADLMVVGHTGVSGLAETVFGSVAQKLVRRAPCSVLVARPLPSPNSPDM
ncbi:MAG: universal stress protein [Desulfarculaceae bacterium]|nr:universal stress protein [Desulfarculaceae bacterium]MCF8072785.1 universal stress protein [Desulfarculaceae bacterium]MCF8100953.1 universal stress protein [Desulfarculaceae bacterium]MCF8117563.1 universal stress protein [Desulfarculaceae bacterium]